MQGYNTPLPIRSSFLYDSVRKTHIYLINEGKIGMLLAHENIHRITMQSNIEAFAPRVAVLLQKQFLFR